jgi:CheY-like chemotaxis protein
MTPGTPVPAPPSGRVASILLVEDDDLHADLFARGLRSQPDHGNVFRVADGEEALRYIRRESPYEDVPVPDVIVLDLKLPRLSGHELLEILKQDPRTSRIPVVILTTSEDQGDRNRAYASHVNSYVAKPLDFGRFNDLVRDLSRYWTEWNVRA